MKLFKKAKEASATLVEMVIISPVLLAIMLYGVGDYIAKLFEKAKEKGTAATLVE